MGETPSPVRSATLGGIVVVGITLAMLATLVAWGAWGFAAAVVAFTAVVGGAIWGAGLTLAMEDPRG